MRRLAQDRAATRRILGLPCAALTRPAATLGLALALCTALAASASAAPTGCAGKPGSPDRAALLQYCPKEAGPGSSTGRDPAASGETGSTSPSSSGTDKGRPGEARSDEPKLPLTDYPSSDGVNVMLILLALLAIGLAVAYGARRWRRSRPQAS